MVDWSLTGREPNFGEEGRWQCIGHPQTTNQWREGWWPDTKLLQLTALHHVHSIVGGKGVAQTPYVSPL